MGRPAAVHAARTQMSAQRRPPARSRIFCSYSSRQRKREHSARSTRTTGCAATAVALSVLPVVTAISYLVVYCTLGLVSVPLTAMLTLRARFSRISGVENVN